MKNLLQLFLAGLAVFGVFGIAGLLAGYYPDITEFAKQVWPNIAASVYLTIVYGIAKKGPVV